MKAFFENMYRTAITPVKAYNPMAYAVVFYATLMPVKFADSFLASSFEKIDGVLDCVFF